MGMADCAIEAESKLIDHLNGLQNRLLEIENSSELRAWSRMYANELDAVLHLVGRMSTEKSNQALSTFLKIEDSKLHFIPTMKDTAKFYLSNF